MRNLHKQQTFALMLTALLLCLLGLSVITGWFTHNLNLIQWGGFSSPMQFNTALCFLFLGMGCFGLAFQKMWIDYISSFTVLTIAVLTVVEYVFGVNLIDEIFIKYTLSFPMVYPGRMALNTAICFTLCSLSLIIGLSDSKKMYYIIPFNAVVISIACLALFGYITGLETAQVWHDFTRMAVHTALGFLLFSLVFFIYEIMESFLQDRLTVVTPFSIGLIFLLATFGLWQGFAAAETNNIQKITEETAHNITLNIKSKLDSDNKSFERMAKRWDVYKQLPLAWQDDANNYIRDITGLRDLHIVNTLEKPSSIPGIIRLSYPLENDRFLIATISIIDVFKIYINEKIGNSYCTILYSGDNQILNYGNSKTPLFKRGAYSSFTVDGQNFTFELFPTEELINNSKGWLPLVIINLGPWMALLSFACVFFAQLVYKKNKKLEQTVKELDNDRYKAKNEIQTWLHTHYDN